MKKLFLMSLLSTLPAFANDGDLVLPGEKWVAKFTKYVCSDAGVAVARPEALETLNVQFETITTDSTLDNGLIKATFEENGAVCRYNAIMFADNAGRTIELVESKAYAPAGDASCATGKAVLDAALLANDYLYYGHPHNLAIMAPFAGAEGLCGDGASLVGINFVVSGRIQR